MRLMVRSLSRTIKETRETIIMFFLLLLLIVVSYANIDESISVVKYHLHWSMSSLTKNYDLYLHSYKDFLLNTLMFHTGGGSAGWKTAFYLLPLFTFTKLFGGLSLYNIYLFTITTSIISLLLFYYWIRKFWGREVAFFSAFFLGYSAVFQEIARSGSYISFSVIFAVIWIIFLYRCSKNKSTLSYFLLGVLTGITWYGYGTLRCLTLVACAYILLSSPEKRAKKFMLFLMGMLIIIAPGIILKLKTVNLQEYKEPFHRLFFDRENIRSLKELGQNIGYFLNRFLGGRQIMEPLITNNCHAHFLNRLLVIPLVAGIVRALKSRRDRKYLLLIVLSLAVYLTPLLITSSAGYRQARRSLLYVIPTYLFIGLGMDGIFIFVKSLSHIIFKRILQLLIFSVIIFIIISEFLFVNTHIIRGNRDLGILKFAKAINTLGIEGEVYYFELDVPLEGKMRDVSTYRFTRESDILRVALMNSRGNFPRLVKINGLTEINPSLKSFYLVKSPLIAEEEFAALCNKNALSFTLLIDSSVFNFKLTKKNPKLKDRFFKLYFIARQTGYSFAYR